MSEADVKLIHRNGRPVLTAFGRTLPLPRSRIARVAIGVLLLIGGVFSILPVLGLWMAPLGVLVLAVDWPPAARIARRMLVWARWLGLRARAWRRRALVRPR